MKFKKNIIVVGGQSFFYWENNKKSKKVIVLLHGFPGNHLGLIDVAHYLDSDYRVIIPDLPACGQSEALKKSHTLKNYAKWLNDFLETLSIQKAIVIGHSFGSRVALVFSVYYPRKVQCLVLITPVVEVDGFIANIASLYYKIGKRLPVYLQKSWLSNKFAKQISSEILFKSSNHTLHKKVIDRDVRELKKINQQIIIELFDELYKNDLFATAKIITTKSLVIAGAKDEIATLKSVAALANKIHNGLLKVMKNSGHFVPLEKPLVVAKVINSYLQKN